MKKIAITLCLILLILPHTFPQITSDFESGDEDGWKSEGDGSYYYEPSNGNPGGCFHVDDYATGDWNNAIAPVKFLGDWSAASPTDYITADVFVHFISGNNASNTYVFNIKGPGGEAIAFADAHPPFEVWNTYTAYLNSANWTIVSGDWNSLLQHVTQIIVRAEYINGDEFGRLDNIELSFTPQVVPVVPVICSDFEDGGYDGWSFYSSGGVSNNSTGGNPGHCLKILDAANTTIAYPPPKFMGDWTQLDNHSAEILSDIKITDFSGTVLIGDYFVEISGPGGTARFPMDSSEIVKAFGEYNTFVVPVDQNYWSILSGTWSGLISNVSEIKMITEFIDGSETVWLDNFCINNLPPEIDFISDRQVFFLGDSINFFDLSTRAPLDWMWNFGDGQTSTSQNPKHCYNYPGVYNVTLTASNYFGSNTMVKTGYIEVLPVDQCLKFEDDFDDNSINPLWITTNGTWSESAGRIAQTSNYYSSNDILNGCYAITGSYFWNGYIVSCDLRSTDNDYIGFVWNWQDEENMYMFYWSAQENLRRVVKWINGVETVLAEDNEPYTSNTWYHFDIEAYEGTQTIIIDGTLIFTTQDSEYDSGKAGLYCWANQSSYWDNFMVECAGTPVEIKVFLEGTFNGIDMNTGLIDNNFLVTSQPYNISPWNYQGTENVQAFSGSDVVDWVLVEFRDASSSENALQTTTFKTDAAILLNTGEIVSPYNRLPLYFNDTLFNDLFVVVRHRNHLDIMSANPLVLSGGVYSYDFTTAASQAYGNDPQKDLGGGTFGMYAGDCNADGTIDDTDRTGLWKQNAGKAGYYSSDLNLDGQSDNPDKNEYLLNNLNKSSQVPE